MGAGELLVGSTGCTLLALGCEKARASGAPWLTVGVLESLGLVLWIRGSYGLMAGFRKALIIHVS